MEGWLRPRADAEPPQKQECDLAEPPSGGQQPELDPGVIEVEEAAGAAQAVILELGVVHAVHRDEPPGGRKPREVALVRSQQAPGDAREPTGPQAPTRLLDAQVGEGVAHSPGVGREGIRTAEGLDHHGILVVHVGGAARREPLRSAVGPGRLPAVRELVERRAGWRSRAHVAGPVS
jgi:hypothetical protein